MHLSRSRTRTRSLTTAALLFLALLAPALTAVTVTAPAAQASGGSSGTSDNSPNPSEKESGIGSGGGDHGQIDGNANWVCDENDNLVLKTDHNIIRQENYPPCKVSDKTWMVKDKVRVCTTGFQVFRFYGSEASPAENFTTSMVNYPEWCNPDNAAADAKRASFWSTSNFDAHGAIDPTKTLNAAPAGFDHGITYETTVNDKGGKDASGPLFTQIWKSARLTGNDNARYNTAGAPYDTHGTCQRAQNDANPIRTYLTSATATAEGKQSVRNWTIGTLNAMAQGGMSWDAAKKEMGIDSWVNGVGGVSDITWSSAACASPMNYVATNEDNHTTWQDQVDNRVTGVCYIPVERLAQLQVANTPNGEVKEFSYPTLRLNQGLRYSDAWDGKKGTWDQPLKLDNEGVATAGLDWEYGVQHTWMNTMKNWYDGRIGAGNEADFLDRNHAYQIDPAGPYKLDKGVVFNRADQNYNTAEAKAALKNAAKCWFGTHIAATKMDDVAPAAPVMAGDVVLHNKPVLHAGGKVTDTQVFTIDNHVYCVSSCEETTPVVQGVQGTVTVQMPVGYSACRSDEVAGPNCDFTVAQVDSDDSVECEMARNYWMGAKSAGVPVDAVPQNVCTFEFNGADQFELIFYNPTEGADKAQVSLSELVVPYVWRQEEGIEVSLSSAWNGTVFTTPPKAPFGQSWVAGAYTPWVTGAPVPMTGNVGFNWRYRAPVIGSVASGL